MTKESKTFASREPQAKITRSEYKAGIDFVKGEVLMRMSRGGRITEQELMNPSRPQEPKARKTPLQAKKVPISKAVRAHGRAHKLTPWKYSSETQGGLPGQGKK
jgi:hypothetical protein